MKKIKLYDYQQTMLENIIKVLTFKRQRFVYGKGNVTKKVANSAMVQMPTGTGKTYVMASGVNGLTGT